MKAKDPSPGLDRLRPCEERTQHGASLSSQRRKTTRLNLEEQVSCDRTPKLISLIMRTLPLSTRIRANRPVEFQISQVADHPNLRFRIEAFPAPLREPAP